MKDTFFIFQMIAHNSILTEWFGHSALPNLGGIWHFPADGKNFQALEIIFLNIFFQTLTTFELFRFEVLAPHGIAKFQISTIDTSISL